MAILEKQYPAIPEPTADPAAMLATLKAIKQTLDIMTGNSARKGSALDDRFRDLVSRNGNLTARFTDYVEVSTKDNRAFAQRIQTLEVESGANTSKIENLETVVLDPEYGLARQVSTLTTDFGDSEARFQQFSETYADDQRAVAQRIDTVEASASGGTAGGKIIFKAEAAPDGWMSQYSLKLTAGDVFTGFDVLARQAADGSTESAIRFTASQFLLFDPMRGSVPVFNYSMGVFRFNVPVLIQDKEIQKGAVTNSAYKREPEQVGSVDVGLFIREGSTVDIYAEFDGQPNQPFPQGGARMILNRIKANADGTTTGVQLANKLVCFSIFRLNSTNTFYYMYTGFSYQDVDIEESGQYSYQLQIDTTPLGPLAIKITELNR